MDYRELFQEENDAVAERYALSMERIGLMAGEETVEEPYRSYFRAMSGFTLMVGELAGRLSSDEPLEDRLEALKEWNHRLYEDILPGRYEESYGNPEYAADALGKELGRLLSFFYEQLRGEIVFAFEGRLFDITILNETLIEIYNLFEGEAPRAKAVRDVLYWFAFDYCDRIVAYRVREGLDPSLNFAADIIMNGDLSDLRYLYRFGEYISESELDVARFLNSLPEEIIDRMADTYTEGYRKGFQVMRRSLEGKKTVMIRYELGFERMIRRAVENFRKMGLEPIFCRAAVWSLNRNPGRKAGYHGSSPNRQYEYDHRYDSAVYLNGALKERKLSVLRTAYESCRELASAYAGPAVVETFGEESFQPVNRDASWKFTKKQEELQAEYSNEAVAVANEYVPGDRISFTIIAFPVPAVGTNFEEIFRETIRINTLDYELYKEVQQTLIAALDRADTVEITGRGSNETRLTVKLHPLDRPEEQTNFENCVADVNIPLGEVFTSPVLAGTDGVLHVGSVYIGGIRFRNLRIRFRDGMVTDYGCENFEDERQGRELVRQVILKNHETLPMGEFAIGTNTAAYAMARRFSIQEKLPILIAEKTGPHFAVGDTCYSWSEDAAVYNPDGREIIARDNEISIRRREDVSRAYYSCHTDITLPYDELDRIEAVGKDGGRTALIAGGLFVLPGTELLNKPLTNQ